jgi:hypothetical protein
MKRILFPVILASLMLFSFVPVFGVTEIVLENGVPSTGYLGGDTVIAGAPVRFEFRMTYTPGDGSVISGSTNGFNVWTTLSLADPSTPGYFTPVTFDTFSVGWSTIYDAGFFFGPSPVDGAHDGIGADTVGFGGFRLFAPGIPDGFDALVWWIETTPQVNGDTLCVDSSFYRPTNVWLWSTTAGSVTPDWGGPYCFLVFDTLQPANNPPVLDPIGAQVVNEGDNLNFGVKASDPDGTTPSLTAENLPTGASFTDNGDGSGTFDWTPTFDQAGVYNVLFIASDGELADSELVEITVNNVNRPPVLDPIGAQAVNEGDNLNFGVTASDPDGTTPSLTAENLPTGASFTDNGDGTGTFDWTPTFDQAGVYNVLFIASDGELADSELVEITVNNINRPPEIEPIADTTITECDTLAATFTATDPDGDAVTLWMATLYPNMTFTDNDDGTAAFSFDPDYTQAGVYPCSLFASDGMDTVMEAFTITVDECYLLDVEPDTLFFVAVEGGTNPAPDTFAVSEVGGGAIAYTLTENTDWFSLNKSSGTTPDDVEVTVDISSLTSGTYFASVEVASGMASNSAIYEYISLTVTPAANNPPVLNPIGAKVVDEGQNLNFIVTASDPDGDLLTIEIDTLYPGMSFTYPDPGNDTGTFTWTPTYDQAGVYYVTFFASDGALIDSEQVEITVNDVNRPPQLEPVADTTIDECETLLLNFSATDPDGDLLEFAIEPEYTNMSFTDNGDGTASLLFTPDTTQAGSYQLILSVTDDFFIISDTFTITVEECVPPECVDTLKVETVPAVPGAQVVVPVNFRNCCDLSSITVKLGWQSSYLHLDSVTFADSRLIDFPIKFDTIDNNQMTVAIGAANDGTVPNVLPDYGNFVNLYFSVAVETPAGFYEIDLEPYFRAGPWMNPSFTEDCGEGPFVVEPAFVPGGIVVDTEGNYVCGYVVDTAGNPIPGATVELWADFPTGTLVDMTIANGSGAFAFSGFNVVPFDLWAYHEGYYPALMENLNFGETGIMLVLTPVDPVTPTNEWVNFYCSENTFMGGPLPVGSVIDAYDPDGVHCGTFYVTEPGKYGFMPVYAEEPYNEGDQGAEPGDTITLFVNGVEAIATGNNVWTQNGDSWEVCLEAGLVVTKYCDLQEGWNLVSWNVDHESDYIEDVIQSISDCVELVLGFEQGGLTYDPDLPEFSTLWYVDHLSGYWIKTSCATTLEVTGAVVPASTPIPLSAGWNLVSYLPDFSMSTPDALSSIYDDLIVALGFDGQALVYLPGEDPYNTLLDMGPCYGYWLKVSQDVDLVYPSNGPIIAASQKGEHPLSTATTAPDITPTTHWLNLYGRNLTIDGETVPAGATITAHTLDGAKIGSFTLNQNGKFGFMPVYADDPATPEVEGVKSGEQFYLAVNGVSTNERFTWTRTGDKIEVESLTAKAGSEQTLPDGYALHQNYPNPFNPTTTISFSLPVATKARIEIYNILGKLVAVPFDGLAKAGTNEVVWDGRNSAGETVSSGIYFYRLTADNYTETKKMTLMK